MARGPAVLIIDDDPAIRRLLRRDLSAAGYRVEDMGPGIDTLAHVAEPRFDVAILDIDLPAFGGPEIISAVREFSSIPILAISPAGSVRRTASPVVSEALRRVAGSC
jgi:two-component system KDP operon response regulator KdpE